MTAGPPVGTLVLPPAVRDAIASAARAAWPAECCGLLVGAPAGASIRVARAVPSPNRADDPRRRFEIDAQLWLDLRNGLARAGGVARIVGCYHSHPDGPAAPSPRDLADAWEPGFAWLIVALAGGELAGMAAWRFEEDETGRRFRPLALEPDDGAARKA